MQKLLIGKYVGVLKSLQNNFDGVTLK